MSTLKKKLRIISTFAFRYREICDDLLRKMGATSYNQVSQDWWLALRFYFDRAFYQGRKDELSYNFELATWQALEKVLGPNARSRKRRLAELHETGSLSKQNWDNRKNTLRKALDEQYRINGKLCNTGKKGDKYMVMDVLRFIHEERSSRSEPLNMVEYIKESVKNQSVKVLAKELDKLFQVGPKIYSFLIRDVVDLFGLSKNIKASDYEYLQPVDTWVRQLAKKLGIEGNDSHVAKKLAEICVSNGVDPIKFNQGAWYLASHSFEILCDNLERLQLCQ